MKTQWILITGVVLATLFSFGIAGAAAEEDTDERTIETTNICFFNDQKFTEGAVICQHTVGGSRQVPTKCIYKGNRARWDATPLATVCE